MNREEQRNDSFYTSEESKILNKTMDIRMKIVDSMVEDGVPIKTNEIRVLKEVIESIDNKTTENAKLRLKHDENITAGNNAELAAEMLKQIASRKVEDVYIPRNMELPSNVKEPTIVTGELEINPPTLTLDDIND